MRDSLHWKLLTPSQFFYDSFVNTFTAAEYLCFERKEEEKEVGNGVWNGKKRGKKKGRDEKESRKKEKNVSLDTQF